MFVSGLGMNQPQNTPNISQRQQEQLEDIEFLYGDPARAKVEEMLVADPSIDLSEGNIGWKAFKQVSDMKSEKLQKTCSGHVTVQHIDD